MSSAEDIFASMNTEEPHIVIGPDRVITVPEQLKRIAVQFDHNIETVTFDCPRYWDEHDMSTMVVYVNYMRADGKPGSYKADNVRVDETDNMTIHFDWTITRNVSDVKGNLAVLVCIKTVDDNGNEQNHWNSELCKDMYVSEGMELVSQIESEYPDLITELLLKMKTVEEINIQADEMQEVLDKAQAAANAAEEAKNAVLDAADSGLSTTEKNLLITILRNGIYSTDQNNNITALATELGVTEEEPDTPETPEVTLSSISATYSGGDVAVGSAVTDLTGIVVTATYSDGSTQTVTDYTLSGEITEGSNTISVSYDGKTTTFTVTGVAESGEATELTIRLGGAAQTCYTDEGNNIYSGSVQNRWISEKIAKVDTEVTIAILYGLNNNYLYQSVGCVVSDLSTEAYYVGKIGHAQETEYTYTYTVKAGYRLGIFNMNGGSPNSITVTTTTPDDWEDVVNDNRFNGEYVVGIVSTGTGDVNAAVTICKTTDYIACADISEIYTFVIKGNKEQHHYGAAFYNADKQFISGANSIEPTTEITPITVPDGAAYIRCSYGGAYGTDWPIYIGASANPDKTTFVTLSTLVE